MKKKLNVNKIISLVVATSILISTPTLSFAEEELVESGSDIVFEDSVVDPDTEPSEPVDPPVSPEEPVDPPVVPEEPTEPVEPPVVPEEPTTPPVIPEVPLLPLLPEELPELKLEVIGTVAYDQNSLKLALSSVDVTDIKLTADIKLNETITIDRNVRIYSEGEIGFSLKPASYVKDSTLALLNLDASLSDLVVSFDKVVLDGSGSVTCMNVSGIGNVIVNSANIQNFVGDAAVVSESNLTFNDSEFNNNRDTIAVKSTASDLYLNNSKILNGKGCITFDGMETNILSLDNVEMSDITEVGVHVINSAEAFFNNCKVSKVRQDNLKIDRGALKITGSSFTEFNANGINIAKNTTATISNTTFKDITREVIFIKILQQSNLMVH